MRNKYRVIVLNPDQSLVYVSLRYVTEEEAKALADRWYNKTDSIGIRRYLVHICKEYERAG
jgi:translation initiation factor 2 alpha subunit (eIF-2alpha)